MYPYLLTRLATREICCVLFDFIIFLYNTSDWGVLLSQSHLLSTLLVQAKQLKNVNEQICQICGDTVGLSATGDVFVACNECAFPVCRPCYEYERKEGNQCCPQCKTRYKRHKGLFLMGHTELTHCFTSSNCLMKSIT